MVIALFSVANLLLISTLVILNYRW